MLGYVGSTPVHWGSKRQGAVASSTYAAEFMAPSIGDEFHSAETKCKYIEAPASSGWKKALVGGKGYVTTIDRKHAAFKKEHYD